MTSPLLLRLGALLVTASLASGCSAPGPEPAPEPDSPLARVLRGREGVDVSVVYRDLASDALIEWNPDTVMHAASTMKVPVMIEVYRRAAAGEFSLDDPLPVKDTFESLVDGSPYRLGPEDDSDREIYDHRGGTLPVRELVRRMIVVSSNLATNLLVDRVGAASVQRTIESLGTRRMKVLRGVQDLKAYEAGLSNTATARDLAALMQALAEGRAVSPEASGEMMEVLAAQQFNRMIPAGLPDGWSVAHKTGSITRIHHDAAVVTDPRGGRYVLVVMTRGYEDPEESAALVAEISRLIHDLREASR